MSKNLQTLNEIIKSDDNNECVLLEQKIIENGNSQENIVINKSNCNSEKKQNKENDNNDSNKKIVIESSNEKTLNDIDTSENINKNGLIEEIIIQSPEKIISKENTKNKENSELLIIKNDISYRSSLNNPSSITNKTNEKTIYTKKGKYKSIDNQLSKHEKEINNNKKMSNIPKRKLQNKNKIRINNDLNYNTQNNTSGQIISYRKLNNSMEKRKRKNNIESNNDKRQDKSHDKSYDKSHDKIIKDKNLEKFNLVYKKFEENEKKKLDKIEKLKKKIEEQNKMIYIYKPRINLKSREILAKKKENEKDFYERQKMIMEKYKKNDEILKEKIKKEKEKEEALKNMNKIRYSYVKSKLYDWEDKQKMTNKININDSIDKEDESSEKTNTIYKIKVNRNINNIVNRLYKNDLEKRKHNLEILNKIYAPSFKPTLFENWKSANKSKSINKDNNSNIIHKSSNHIKINSSLENINYHEKRDKSNNMTDIDNVTDLLRNRLFSKNKNKERYRSEIKFNNVINEENIYEIRNGNKHNKNSKIKLYKNPKLSRSFVRQKKYQI